MATPIIENSPAQMITKNAQYRQALLASAPRMRKKIGTVTGATAGSTSRIKLFNVGVTTRILLDVTLTTDIVTATATLSEKAPFNLINRVKLTDYDGTDRINMSGYQAFVLACVRRRGYFGYNNQAATAVGAGTLPTSIATLTAGSARTFRFQLELPLAFNQDNDLRGALLTQTAVGEAYINIDWNSLLYTNANDDAFFNGAATTTLANSTITVTAYQEYLLPQPVAGQVPLPALDLMTVYELAGALRTSDNIASGSEKLINYPNVRSVLGCYVNYRMNSLMAAADTTNGGISQFRLIANGNNVLREYGTVDKLFEQRLLLDSDIRKGTYFELHREKPVETALFGNVQLGLTPSGTITGSTDFEVMFESFYTKGSMLPGMTQGS